MSRILLWCLKVISAGQKLFCSLSNPEAVKKIGKAAIMGLSLMSDCIHVDTVQVSLSLFLLTFKTVKHCKVTRYADFSEISETLPQRKRNAAMTKTEKPLITEFLPIFAGYFSISHGIEYDGKQHSP